MQFIILSQEKRAKERSKERENARRLNIATLYDSQMSQRDGWAIYIARKLLSLKSR